MAVGFTGKFDQKVDGKGRVSVPARMRRIVEAGDPDWDSEKGGTVYLVFGSHLDGNVQGYTASEFDRLTTRIMKLKRNNPKRKQLQRVFLTQSIDMTVDPAGRAVLPPAVREKLEIGASGAPLLFTGMGDMFEIWVKDTYLEKIEPALEEADDEDTLMAALDDLEDDE